MPFFISCILSGWQLTSALKKFWFFQLKIVFWSKKKRYYFPAFEPSCQSDFFTSVNPLCTGKGKKKWKLQASICFYSILLQAECYRRNLLLIKWSCTVMSLKSFLILLWINNYNPLGTYSIARKILRLLNQQGRTGWYRRKNRYKHIINITRNKIQVLCLN